MPDAASGRWDFIPDDWPEIESRQEYLALMPMLTGFEQAIAFVVEGELVQRLRISADGLRFRMREFEQQHGIEPAP